MTAERKAIWAEENAEVREVSGWCCKTCDRFWRDDERAARFCCAESYLCGCGKFRHAASRTRCSSCQLEHSRKVFDAMPKHPWPEDLSGSPVFMLDDLYFFDSDLAVEHVQEWLAQDSSRELRDVQPFLCKTQAPPEFDMGEWLLEHLPDGHEADYSLDDQINALIRQAADVTWSPTNKAIDVSTMPAACMDPVTWPLPVERT